MSAGLNSEATKIVLSFMDKVEKEGIPLNLALLVDLLIEVKMIRLLMEHQAQPVHSETASEET